MDRARDQATHSRRAKLWHLLVVLALLRAHTNAGDETPPPTLH